MGVQEFFDKHKTSGRENSFHSQLGVPHGDKIPLDLLERIKNAHSGEVIYNPYHTTDAKEYIKVTPLWIKKARFLINMRKKYKRPTF